MSPKYSAIIADDEPLLRQHLQALLMELWPDLNIIGLAANGEEAWTLIKKHEPDMVFLDIRMPMLDGINLARRFVDLESPPLTTFVTAYDQHAVEAFDNKAIDYLLKPIDESRLEKTIIRIKHQLSLQTTEPPLQQEEHDRFQQLLSLLSTNKEASIENIKWIKASKSGAIHVLPVEEVHFFQAESKYTTVANNDGEFLIKTSITALEQQLQPEFFWRIHRNCLVNVNKIAKVERDFAGHMFVYLNDNTTRLSVSRSYQNLFKQM